MKAIILKKFGNAKQAFEFVERDIPVPEAGQLCIRVEAFGLNFADVMARRGLYQDCPPLPACLGYDVAGTVHSIGSEVSGFKIGDRVFGMTRFGGYSQYVCTDWQGVARIPQKMDAPTATALATQYTTAYHCAFEAARLHEGDKVLIQAGAGGVGTALVQLAKHFGCTVAATASTAKQDYLKNMGVDLPIDYTKEDYAQVIRAKWGKNPIDIAFDSVGGKSFVKGLKLLAPGGKIVPYGAAAQISGSKTNKLKAIGVGLGFGFFSPIPLLMRSQGIIGVNMLQIADYKAHLLQSNLNQVTKLVALGALKPVLGKLFSADQIAQAHSYLESRQSIGKIALKW